MVTSGRSVTLSMEGDVEYSQTFSAVNSSTGSGQNQLIELSTGNNLILVPDDAIAATIIMPSGNDVQVSLKAVSGDTGLDLHLTDPTSIGLNEVASFVLHADDDISVRIIFS